MQIYRLSDDMTISDQIVPGDIAALRADGVVTLIINRPDIEVPPSKGSTAVTRAAEDAGMAVHYIPYVPGRVDEGMIADFAAAVAQPGKAHAYCRSGTRSTHLWALSQAGAVPTEQLVRAAAAAGYDLSGLIGAIDARAAASAG